VKYSKYSICEYHIVITCYWITSDLFPIYFPGFRNFTASMTWGCSTWFWLGFQVWKLWPRSIPFFDWKLNNKYQHKIHKMEIDVTVSSNVGNPIMSLPFGDGFNHLLMVISLDSNKYLKW
jgi:hypothetical protein